MEKTTDFTGPLLETAEKYRKISVELIRLKLIDKTTDITSGVISKAILISVFSVFAITMNIALALWLGDVLGKSYYGFLLVSSIYALISLIVFFARSSIKKSIHNLMIKKLLD